MTSRPPSFLAVPCFGFTPVPLRLFRQQIVSLSQSYCVSQVQKLTDERGGEGAGVEPNHTTARKLGPPLIVQSCQTL
jgi:hypothetical protein